MAGVREIRARIQTIKKIEQVTTAMKLVAAARLRRAQERAEAGRPYADTMQAILNRLAPSLHDYPHPLLQTRPVERIGVIVLSAERGLAGSYNTNLMRELQSFLRSHSAEARLSVLGKKGTTYLKRRGYNVVFEDAMPGSDISASLVRSLSAQAQAEFANGTVDEVYLAYSRFVSAMTQRPTVMRLLPMEPPSVETGLLSADDVILEPSPRTLLDRLLPRYVDAQIYRAIAEAVAGEHGARMTSMSSASDNAGEMIKDLTLSYNRARQASITTELSEIVAGADALKQE